MCMQWQQVSKCPVIVPSSSLIAERDDDAYDDPAAQYQQSNVLDVSHSQGISVPE